MLPGSLDAWFSGSLDAVDSSVAVRCVSILFVGPAVADDANLEARAVLLHPASSTSYVNASRRGAAHTREAALMSDVLVRVLAKYSCANRF